ncbi:MAG: formate dehydrogenase [Pseudomonadota bacterium]|nr:formate dehydrogenase [Pseudomonadota bacterium]
MNTTWRALMVVGLVVASFGLAVAKLPPAPPMDDKAKAAAEEKKAKDAATADAQKAAQARAEDRVAQRYINEQRAKGVTVHPTPIAASPAAPVTTAQGNTPATSAPGQSAETKGPGSSAPATNADASKDSNKK